MSNYPVQRKLVFSEQTEQQIVNYYEAPLTESKTDGAQVKLTTTQKIALKSICAEQGIGVSTFISEAIEHRLKILQYGDKWDRYEKAILNFMADWP